MFGSSEGRIGDEVALLELSRDWNKWEKFSRERYAGVGACVFEEAASAVSAFV
jgi:hypothetical protein